MGEELVMAVRTEELFGRGYFQGLKPGAEAWLDFILDPRHSRFLPRTQAENDPAWKQIIPYVVLECAGAVFCYRRGQKSSETRLVALHSIGLGGHIRATDESMFSAPGREAYRAGLERELAEEVDISGAVLSDAWAGLINDDSTEVGRVHLGVVHVRRLSEPKVKARESKIAGGRWLRMDQLAGPQAPELESWSRLCVEAWEQLDRAKPE